MPYAIENKKGLSASTMKILACIFMLIDHAGLLLFPRLLVLRAIGRLAFPIFAYFIAEGCHYTRHRLKHFLLVFGSGVLCFIFYYFYEGVAYGNIFLTFSVSILMIYLLDYCKKLAFRDFKAYKLILAALIYIAAIVAVRIVTKVFKFDYGFVGIMIPPFVSLFDFGDLKAPKLFRELDRPIVRLIMLLIGLLPLCIGNVHGKLNIFGMMIPVQWFCLFSLPIIAFYSGKPGIRQLKYAFYAFYPLHLLILVLIGMLIK